MIDIQLRLPRRDFTLEVALQLPALSLIHI